MLLKHASLTFLTVYLLGLPTTTLAAALFYPLDARTPTPIPLVVPPSGRWFVHLFHAFDHRTDLTPFRDGIDGPWSSFDLSIGGPAQTVRVLISTSSNQPWVVLPEGCPSSARADCANSRGDIYSPGTSASKPTW
jgi:hypothetical protein